MERAKKENWLKRLWKRLGETDVEPREEISEEKLLEITGNKTENIRKRVKVKGQGQINHARVHSKEIIKEENEIVKE